MSQQREKPKLLQTLKLRCQQYLQETTVHGLRYLIDSRNICEVIVWAIAITFGLVIAVVMIYSSITNSYNDPILTSVQTASIETVSRQI